MRLLLRAIATVFAITTFSFGDEPISVTNIVDTLRINSGAIKRYDVLILTTRSADKKEAGFLSSRVLTRLIYDSVSSKIAQFSTGKFKSQNGVTLEERDLLKATNIHDNISHSRIWPGPEMVDNHESFRAAANSQELMTVEFVGGYQYPLGPSTKIEVSDAKWTRLKGRYAMANKVSTLGNDATFVVERAKWHEHILVDLVTMMPKRRSQIHNSEANRGKVFANELFKWIEVNDIQMPQEVAYDSLQVATLPNGENLHYEMNVVHEMHWVSVNEELDQRLFDVALMKDAQKCRLLTEPLPLGAKQFSSKE